MLSIIIIGTQTKRITIKKWRCILDIQKTKEPRLITDRCVCNSTLVIRLLSMPLSRRVKNTEHKDRVRILRVMIEK